MIIGDNIELQNDKQQITSSKSRKWMIVSAFSTVTGVLSYFLIMNARYNYGDSVEERFNFVLTWMPYAMIILAASFVLSIIATVKARKYAKVITVSVALIAVIIFMLAWFAYWIAQPNYG